MNHGRHPAPHFRPQDLCPAAQRARGDTFLAAEAAEGLAERIGAVNRRFKNALGSQRAAAKPCGARPARRNWTQTAPGTADEEALPFAPETFDLIVSVLSLHAVNDLPGALVQIRRALKPDGLFLAALFGGETLHELREAFAAGESETVGGVSPRVSPFADVRDLGGLLQRAGFALPVADVERTTVRYANFETAGRRSARAGRNQRACRTPQTRSLRKDTLAAAAIALPAPTTPMRKGASPRHSISSISRAGRRTKASRRPLAPGSAKTRLADALKP